LQSEDISWSFILVEGFSVLASQMISGAILVVLAVCMRGTPSRGFDRGRGRMDETTRRELRRRQLCFTCKEPWDPTHKCMGKDKAHYIEVICDDEEEEGFDHLQNMEADPA
jgi:hypothetical protein